jgi:hypothetical protein
VGIDTPTRSLRRSLWLLPASLAAVVVVLAFGFALALGGGDLGGLGAGGSTAGPVPTRAAVGEIPPRRLRLYQQAGRRYDIDWAFLASIGAQECNHGVCAGDNGSGCAGPMQISMRRGSPCSPGAGPTLWETYGVDGNRDGRRDVNDPADAVPAAARILRRSKGAPPAGGSYAGYRQAACNYYGACFFYADEVMARAVQYGFQGPGSPPPADPDGAQPAPDQAAPVTGCGGVDPTVGDGPIGPVERARRPRRFVALPDAVVSPAHRPQRCDARIVRNVVYLARRFQILVTACAEIHSPTGEHPLGAAIDAIPADGDWTNTTERAARALGWKPSCAAGGVAPACAKPPFRFIAYNGYPGHGDPAHCVPPACAAHLHLSWNTSASQGGPESSARLTLFNPAWIDVFTISEGRRRG